MNDIIQNIKTRRSIRKYDNRQLNDEDLQLIVEAAQYAPSGSNSQSWLFTVIQKPELLTEINQLVRQAFGNITFGEHEYPAKIAGKKKAEQEAYCFYYHAPTLIIVSNKRNYSNAMADSALALGNIFLAAHSLGIGSCWVNQLSWLCEEPVLRVALTRLGIPEDHMICGSAVVGYLDGQQPPAPLRKPNTVNIIK